MSQADTSPPVRLVQPGTSTLETLSAKVDAVAADVTSVKSDVSQLKTTLLGEGGVLQRTAAVEKAWHQTAPATVGKYTALITLAGVVAEVIRAHNPAIGDALQGVVKAFGVGG